MTGARFFLKNHKISLENTKKQQKQRKVAGLECAVLPVLLLFLRLRTVYVYIGVCSGCL